MASENFDSIPLLQNAFNEGTLLLKQPRLTVAAVKSWETDAEHSVVSVFGADSPYVKQFNAKTHHVGALPSEHQKAAWKREQLEKQVSVLADLLKKAGKQKSLLIKSQPRPPEVLPDPVQKQKVVMSPFKLHGFIASSVQGLSVARAVESNLHDDFELVVWNQGVFEPSHYPIESLVKELRKCDFGIFIFNPEDVIQISNSKGGEQVTVRDNVILELGLFIGRLGRKRVFIVKPSNVPNFRLPSDLLGLTTLPYDLVRKDGSLRAALGPACNDIRTAMQKTGYFKGSGRLSASNAESPPDRETTPDRTDYHSTTEKPREPAPRSPAQALARKEIEKMIKAFENLTVKLHEATEDVVTSFESIDRVTSVYIARHFPEFRGYTDNFPIQESHKTQVIHKDSDIQRYKAVCEDRIVKLRDILEVL